MATLGPGGGLVADPGASWFNNTWGGSQAYGSKPTVPLPTTTAGQTIAGNIGNLGQLYGLAGGINQFQAQQAQNQLAQNLPGYREMINKSSGNIASMLAGRLPSDVVSQITQNAAARGIIMGGTDSPAGNAALMRALGLTSLGLQSTGEQELTGAIQRTPTGGLFNTASMMVTPEQQQAAMMAQALYNAAPDPSAAARASLANAQAGLRGGLGTPMGGGAALRGAPSAGGMPTSYGPIGSQGQGQYYNGVWYPEGSAPSGANAVSAAPTTGLGAGSTAGWGGWQGGQMYPSNWTAGGAAAGGGDWTGGVGHFGVPTGLTSTGAEAMGTPQPFQPNAYYYGRNAYAPGTGPFAEGSAATAPPLTNAPGMTAGPYDWSQFAQGDRSYTTGPNYSGYPYPIGPEIPAGVNPLSFYNAPYEPGVLTEEWLKANVPPPESSTRPARDAYGNATGFEDTYFNWED